MKNKAILLVAMSLATAWAVRGQFGHEHGAAWAGSIGSISILLLANRKDWTAKAFRIILAGALGWGIGGVMSYGMVVGYGRSTDFVNVYYGLASLFLIGGLYGFMGGGLFGLALTDSQKNPIPWPQLIVEMVVSALVFYFFIIVQFEFLMTPPRDESWAGVLGLAAALFWYLFRTQQWKALRVALFAGLGGGFGFAFGNFLQVLGTVSEIKFNFWNVMEYSLGFFGGIGMAYGTFTSEWEDTSAEKAPNQWPAILLLTLIIPFIMWQQNFRMDRLTETVNKLNFSDAEAIILSLRWDSLFLIFAASAYWIYTYSNTPKIEYPTLKQFFITHFGLYILLSLLITSAILSTYRIEQYLYIVNFGIILYLINNTQVEFSNKDLDWKKYGRNFAILCVIVAILALIACYSHGELKGAHNRF